MFDFIVVFILSLVCIFILMQSIDCIFSMSKKIKSALLSSMFMSFSLWVSFLLSIIVFYLALNFLIKIPIYLGIKTEDRNFETLISPTDCLLLTNAIRETENRIGEKENHRYLEEVAHLFTIKLEYQKAAQKLKEQVKIYHNLELSPEAEKYTHQIGTKFQEQSELFLQRNAITTNKEGVKKVYKLLEKMDKIDRERLRLIERVKQQCNNTA